MRAKRPRAESRRVTAVCGDGGPRPRSTAALRDNAPRAQLGHSRRVRREDDASAARPVAKKDRPALKPALVEQIEPRVDVVRQRSLATADENRHEQQVQLVDQARDDRLTGELGAADADVRPRALLHPLDRVGVKFAFDARPGT